MNSAKAIEKDLKVLKTKLSEEGVLDKSFEAKLLERQRKGTVSFGLPWVIVHNSARTYNTSFLSGTVR